MRHSVKLVVVVALLAVPSIAVAAGSANQTWAINCTREQYKPARIIVSCGDAGIWLGKLKWTRWNGHTAQANGVYNENTCTPTCAAGHNVSRPVRVTLSQPRTCPGHAHPAFKRATFAFPSGAPPAAYHRFTFSCPY
jgi:hypothetical protein